MVGRKTNSNNKTVTEQQQVNTDKQQTLKEVIGKLCVGCTSGHHRSSVVAWHDIGGSSPTSSRSIPQTSADSAASALDTTQKGDSARTALSIVSIPHHRQHPADEHRHRSIVSMPQHRRLSSDSAASRSIPQTSTDTAASALDITQKGEEVATALSIVSSAPGGDIVESTRRSRTRSPQAPWYKRWPSR